MTLAMQPLARELIELHAQTLFTHDADGRLLAINEVRPRRPARWFAGWTAEAAIWRVSGDLPAALVARIRELMAALPTELPLDQPLPCAAAVRALLAAHAPIGQDEGGPAYVVPDGVAAAGADVVAVTAANAEVLRRWLPEWLPDVETGLPIAATIVDGAAVAICACARLPGAATEAGVETHPAFRGRGYVGAAVAAWAAEMRARGVLPLYSTSWANAASQRVAAKLGLVRYGASHSIY